MIRLRAAVAVGTIWVGVVLGHLASYGVLYPAADRGEHLQATGHADFRFLVLGALAVLPVVLVAFALRTLRREGHAHPVGAVAVRLAVFQVPAFLLLEAAERGFVLERILAEPAVLLGLAIQILVALVAAWLLAVFARVIIAIADRVRASRMTDPADARPGSERSESPRLVFLLRLRGRAPPSFAV